VSRALYWVQPAARRAADRNSERVAIGVMIPQYSREPRSRNIEIVQLARPPVSLQFFGPA